MRLILNCSLNSSIDKLYPKRQAKEIFQEILASKVVVQIRVEMGEGIHHSLK